MQNEEKVIIAFLYKRSGKEKLNFSDLYLTLSMDLNWYSPEEAKAFVESALKKEFLKQNEKSIEPNFDITEIDVPLGFHPKKQITEKKEKKTHEEKDIFSKILKHIIEKTSEDKKTVIEKITKTEHEKNVTKEVAALLVGKEYNVEVTDFLSEVEKNLFTENKE